MTVSELIEYLQQLPPDMVVAMVDSSDICRRLDPDEIKVETVEPAWDCETNRFSDTVFDPTCTFFYFKDSSFYKGDQNAVAPEIKVLVIGG